MIITTNIALKSILLAFLAQTKQSFVLCFDEGRVASLFSALLQFLTQSIIKHLNFLKWLFNDASSMGCFYEIHTIKGCYTKLCKFGQFFIDILRVYFTFLNN